MLREEDITEALIDVLSKYVFEFVDGSTLQRGICAYHSFHTNIHTYLNEFYIESFNCRTVLLFTTSTTICRLAISPHTDNGMRLRVAQVSVFEWKLVGPKGQGHTHVGAVATNFLMTAFIIMSQNAPSYLLWSLTRISVHFCNDIVHLSTATVKQRALFWLILISSHAVPCTFHSSIPTVSWQIPLLESFRSAFTLNVE